jgi:hypothetical protein
MYVIAIDVAFVPERDQAGWADDIIEPLGYVSSALSSDTVGGRGPSSALLANMTIPLYR